MLVLTRTPRESILIDNQIEVMVAGIWGERVRLRITDPQKSPVQRDVVFYPNESVALREDIDLLVVEIRTNHVRLGIKAPNHVLVNRKEVEPFPREPGG